MPAAGWPIGSLTKMLCLRSICSCSTRTRGRFRRSTERPAGWARRELGYFAAFAAAGGLLTDSQRHLQWLSRRWIYNIPRSLKTQGFRPLGRLAFVDHCQRVRERIVRAVKAACDPVGLAASAMAAGMANGEFATICVVSSTSGGSGGGMAINVGYLVRQTLRELCVEERALRNPGPPVGPRPASPQSGRGAPAPSWESCANTAACRAIRAIPLAVCPRSASTRFSQTYFLHLGKDLEEGGFAAAAAKLAKYLYYNAATPAGTFFDKCRANAADAASCGAAEQQAAAPASSTPAGDAPAMADGAELRPLPLGPFLRQRSRGGRRGALPIAVGPLGGATSRGNRQTVHVLVGSDRLVGFPACRRRVGRGLRAEVTARMQAAELNAEQIVEELHSTATREMGANPESYLLTVLEQLVADPRRRAWGFSTRMPPSRWILDALDTLIRSQDTAAGRQVCLEAVLDERIARWQPAGAGLSDWILGLAVSPAHRILGAQRATDFAMEYLRILTQQASESIQAVRSEHSAIEATLLVTARKLQLVAVSRVRQATPTGGRSTGTPLLSLENPGGHAQRRVPIVGRLLSQTAAVAVGCATWRLISIVWRPIAAHVRSGRRNAGRGRSIGRHPTVGGPNHRPVQDGDGRRDGTGFGGRFRIAVTEEPANARRLLARALRRAAQATVRRTLRKIGQQEMISSGEPLSQERTFSMAAALKQAASQWPGCGADRRLLLVAPRASRPDHWPSSSARK